MALGRAAWWALAAGAVGCGSSVAVEPTGQGGSSVGGSASGGDVPPAPCTLELQGEPMVLMGSDEPVARPVVIPETPAEAATASDLTVLALVGSNTSGSGFRVERARYRLGAPWPTGVQQTVPPSKWLGVSTPVWLTKSHDAKSAVAVWEDHGGALTFERLGLSDWTTEASAQLSILPEHTTPYEIVRGRAPSNSETGDYAVAWRELQVAAPETLLRPVVAVVDGQGKITLGPHGIGALSPSPGAKPTLVWTTEHYLVAHGRSCDACDEPLSLYRIDPDDDDDAELLWTEALDAVTHRPVLLAEGGRVWLAAFVGPNDLEGHRDLVLYELGVDGGVLSGPTVIESGARPLGDLRGLATPLGLVLAWGGAIDEPTPSTFRTQHVRHLDREGALRSPPVDVATGFYPTTHWRPAITPIAAPRGMLVTWAAEDA
ncbi:MAG: hypothetical protein RIF41_26695, partial [Polyangiaceae bacterium]